MRVLPKLKLKHKITLSIALLVLVVVVAVNLVFLAGSVHQQLQDTFDHANFLAQEIYNELGQELAAAYQQGAMPAGPDALAQFFQGRAQSPALASLFSAGIGYNGTIRDVALVSPQGLVVMDSNPLLEGQPQPRRRLMSEVLDSGIWHQVQAVVGAEAIYSVSLATEVQQRPLGTISVGVDTVLLRQALFARLHQLMLYGGLIVLIATALAWGLSDLALAPLNAISVQLDRLRSPAHAAASAAGSEKGDELGRVQSKIQLLGEEIADARQVYSALQENVGQLLQGLDEGLLLFDAKGQCVMASAAAPQLLNLPFSSLAGRSVADLFPGDSSLDRAVRSAVREGASLEPVQAERNAGARPLLARLDVVRDGGGQPGALLTVRDAEPVHRLEGELELARRLSAVGRLTRGVAHEVKNPLNAMALHLDLLRAKAASSGNGLQSGMQPHLQVLSHEIERLDRVVRTFLDFSRPVELQLKPTDLSELARGVAQLAEAEAASLGLRIVVRAPQPGPRAWVDRDLVEQALLNLINNGLQAMQPAAAGCRLDLEVESEAGFAAVRVRDQGPGVPAEHRDRIFDLYFTTRSTGTGIGLAMAARTMQLHHGSIELEPPGVVPGASFLLRFPRRAQETGGGAGA